MKEIRRALVSLLSFVALFLAGSADAQCPQATCRQNVAREDAHWPAGAAVNVYISNAFTYDQQMAIAQSFQNWASIGMNNGITYTIHYGIPSVITAPYPHTVERAVATGIPGVQGETASPNVEMGHTYDWAFTKIDPRVTSLDALRWIMSHEIGHTMGLSDCQDCCPGSTVMLGGRPDPADATHADWNFAGGPQSPTGCDTQNSIARIEQDAADDDDTTPSGGGGDTRLVDDTSPGGGGVSCYVEYTYSCNYNYTDCYILSYRYLGCW